MYSNQYQETPSEQQGSNQLKRQQSGKKWIIGIFLMAAGGTMLIDQLDGNHISWMWQNLHWWPAIFAMFGILKIVFSNGMHDIIQGATQVLISVWLYFCIEHIWGWTFRTTWPVVLILVGTSMVLRAIYHSRHQ